MAVDTAVDQDLRLSRPQAVYRLNIDPGTKRWKTKLLFTGWLSKVTTFFKAATFRIPIQIHPPKLLS